MTHLQSSEFARYLDRRSPAEETARVETHLADCADCRAHFVALRPIVSKWRGRARRILYAAAAAAVVFIAFLQVTNRGSSKAAELRALGALRTPPAYSGLSVRAASSGQQWFSDGMKAYVTGQYPEAIGQLTLARSEGITGIAVPFFLGSSLLMSGDPTAASRELAQVTASESPYLSEAHYLLAKALLQLNRHGDAIVELDRAVLAGGDSTTTAAAASLRDSVRALRAR